MPPYQYQYNQHYSPSGYQYTPTTDYQYGTPIPSHHERPSYNSSYNSNHSAVDDYSNRDSIISSLREKLGDRDAEIIKLLSENSQLKNDLREQKQLHEAETRKVEKLESICEEMDIKLNEQTEDIRGITLENDELHTRQRGLELALNKLERAVGAREDDLSSMEKELMDMRKELQHATDSKHDGNRVIHGLESQMEDLAREIRHYKAKAQEVEAINDHLYDRERELKSLLKEGELMLEQQEKEINTLTRKSRGLEYDTDAHSSMLEEQELDIANMKRMISKLNDIIKSQETALDKKDTAMMELTRDIKWYKQMVGEVKHSNSKQKYDLEEENQDREKEIEKLKDELKQDQVGILSFWKGCGGNS